MNFRINTNSCKNAMGTVFLLATAFFVCSTFISMRSVFADPVAPANALPQRSSQRQSPRANATSRATTARTTASRASATTETPKAATVSRGTNANRTVSSRGTVTTRGTTTATRTGTASRNVISRGTTGRTTASNRAVRARTGSTQSRVSANGTLMAGSRSGTSTQYSYLASKLYNTSYSDIVDSSTGLISADAYSNCMESYYACMDEICTARSDTKGRCSCAGRAISFLEAETALETANEELIKLSGQLSLLIATKGKGDDLASAFSLTDAEKVMNCVSWKDAYAECNKNNATKDSCMKKWYDEHPTYDSTGNLVTSSYTTAPSYCSNSGNNFGFDISSIDGSGSDILAQLVAYADAADLAKQYTVNDEDSLLTKYGNISGVVDALAGVIEDDTTNTASLDALANKWGYELFEYAHNNVCGRVLDACFNGIYEACGTPVSVTESDGTKHNKCANGATSNCPFNYNTYISVDETGDVALNERGASNATSQTSASCFGYTTYTNTSTARLTTTTSSTDPYATLRGPVADARRSIMQKYLLDANAACDAYGTSIKTAAQNINYQRIAAQQALEQKRLEFKQEAEATTLANAQSAIDNFNECISEIWDCYDEYSDDDDNRWTTARIKAYCSQVSQVPHCYETMICSPLQTQLVAVVDKADSQACTYSNDYNENTCRNVVTINEVLYGTGQDASNALDNWDSVGTVRVSSAAVRENCLERALGCSSGDDTTYCLRNWKKNEN